MRRWRADRFRTAISSMILRPLRSSTRAAAASPSMRCCASVISGYSPVSAMAASSASISSTVDLLLELGVCVQEDAGVPKSSGVAAGPAGSGTLVASRLEGRQVCSIGPREMILPVVLRRFWLAVRSEGDVGWSVHNDHLRDYDGLVAIGVRRRVWAAVLEVREEVALVVVGHEAAFALLDGVDVVKDAGEPLVDHHVREFAGRLLERREVVLV